ncbi:MFS transporter [Alloactinosynnema sp. L-07]|uniref:MFS transporter n=1 Tax=Alloactinosynnema sp. L-07 TaxID=1653480 RepID=UPI0012F9FD57|nr:MFS transporter [Alloactinosynnema sp. L-07]
MAAHPRRWLILGVVCLAQLVVLLDNTVLNLVIPSLTRDLGATTQDIQWMVNAYSLALAGLLLTAGSLGDRYGQKKAQLAGLALFGAASLASALSQTPAQLIAARAAMGIGGALLMTTTLAVVVRVFEGNEQAKAIGVWGAISSFGFAVGPLVGGVLLTRFWWGSVFLINVPIALVGIIAVAKLVPESRNPRAMRPDSVGAALSTAGMVGVVYAIIASSARGWASVDVLAAAGVGIAAFVAFVRWESRQDEPMFDVALFHNRRFVGAALGGLLVAFGMAGSLFLLTQHLQFVLGHSPIAAGIRLAPLAMTIVGVNLLGLGAKLLVAAGAARTVAIGMSGLAVGLTAVALLDPVFGYPGMLLGLVVMGCGLAMAMPAMVTAIVGAMPARDAGVGAGVQGTVTEFGGGLGVAVLGALLTERFAALLPAPLGADVADSLPDAVAAAGGADMVSRVREAFAAGVNTSQLIGAGAVMAGGLLAALLLRRTSEPTHAQLLRASG